MLFPVYTGSNKTPSLVKWPLKCSNLDDIELLRLAGARGRVKANQAVIQDSPGHLQSILAQSQLKLAGSVEGHQFPFKLKAILKSRQSLCGLRWFNGSSQQKRPVKSARRTRWWVLLSVVVEQDSVQSSLLQFLIPDENNTDSVSSAGFVLIIVLLCRVCHNRG